MVHPGQTFNLDYSLTHAFSLQPSLRLQLGLVGYGQWQTTDKRGPNITVEQAAAHYKVNALGFAANAILPEQKVSVGVSIFTNSSADLPTKDTHSRSPRRLRSNAAYKFCFVTGAYLHKSSIGGCSAKSQKPEAMVRPLSSRGTVIGRTFSSRC